MIHIKNPDQINKMRTAGKKLHEVLEELKLIIKPGVSTKQLDIYAEKLIKRLSASPSFLGYNGYPATLCTSINDEVVHGIPDDEIYLKDGDILSVDCGLIHDGWHSDSAFTIGVGTISLEAHELIKATERCFWEGVGAALAGKRVGDIGQSVQNYAEDKGYGVVRALTGHGIGRNLHEEPSVPNFGRSGFGTRLQEGMTICIEPMISMRSWEVVEMSNNWTYSTKDKSLAAHYEHTIAITEQGLPEILTLPGFNWEEYEHEA